MTEECKISFHFYTEKESKEVKWRDLVGPEKLKLFSKTEMYPDLPNVQKVQKIWLSIYNLLHSPNTDSKEVKTAAKKWIILFLKVYQTKHVTPYMHALVLMLSSINNLKSVRFFKLVLWYDYSIVICMFLACWHS